MERRDYSQIEWPWEDDPCWGAPREGATSDVNDSANWTLACGVCALRLPNDLTMETVEPPNGMLGVER